MPTGRCRPWPKTASAGPWPQEGSGHCADEISTDDLSVVDALAFMANDKVTNVGNRMCLDAEAIGCVDHLQNLIVGRDRSAGDSQRGNSSDSSHPATWQGGGRT